MEEDQKEITALKDEAYDRLSAAEALCDRLNDGLHVLKMCPTGAKYSRDKDLSVKVGINTSHSNEHLWHHHLHCPLLWNWGLRRKH